MNKYFFLSMIATFMMLLDVNAQNNTYNIVISMNNGSEISIGSDEIRKITFSEGKLDFCGNDIQSLLFSQVEMLEEIANLKNRINELSNDVANLKNGDTSNSQSTIEAKFVGSWTASVGGSGHNFVFLPNGRAMRDRESFGKWSYNEEKQILATTLEMWSFNITAIFDDEWVGTTVNTGKSVNARKESDAYFIPEYLRMLTWISEDGKSFVYDDYYYSTVSNINFDNENASFDIKRSRKEYTYTDKFEIEKMYSEKPALTIRRTDLGTKKYYGTFK